MERAPYRPPEAVVPEKPVRLVEKTEAEQGVELQEEGEETPAVAGEQEVPCVERKVIVLSALHRYILFNRPLTIMM